MIRDPVLGPLARSEILSNTIEGSFDYCGRVVALLLGNEEDNFESAISIAKSFVQGIENFDRLARDYATLKLLNLYNDVWREVDEIDEEGNLFSDPVLSEEEFQGKIQLRSIAIDASDQDKYLSCDFYGQFTN